MSNTLDDTFVMNARDLTLAHISQGKPTMAMEVGADGGGMIGILKAIAFNDAGVVIKAVLQIGDDLEVSEMVCDRGLHLVQGQYADIQYAKRKASRDKLVAEFNDPRSCKDCGKVHDEDHGADGMVMGLPGSASPGEMMSAIRRVIEAQGGVMLGGGVIDDGEDDETEIPSRTKGGPIKH